VYAFNEDENMSKPMSVEHAVEAFAGFMVLLSVALTYFVHPGWMWLTVFVGANLFQQSFTGFCPAAFVMRKVFGLKPERELSAG
jgi:hypothetical protein